MEDKGLSIQDLVAFCNAAKEVYEYYDGNMGFDPTTADGSSSNPSLFNEYLKRRNMAHDRYISIVMDMEKRLNEYFKRGDLL